MYKILILNNQHNPLGVSCSRAQLTQIAEWCNKYDAYFDLTFDPERKLSITSFPGMRDRTVILFTFSKFASMTA
eukprot:gene19462-10123_t